MTPILPAKTDQRHRCDFFGNIHQLITRLVNANTLKMATQCLESILCR